MADFELEYAFLDSERSRWLDLQGLTGAAATAAQNTPSVSGVGFTGLDARLADELNNYSQHIRDYLREGSLQSWNMNWLVQQTKADYEAQEEAGAAAAGTVESEANS